MTDENPSKTISLADVANVIDNLGITIADNCEHLNEWCQASGNILPEYAFLIEEGRQDLLKNVGKWNEEELKMHFLSLVFRASHLSEPNKIGVFYERSLAGTIDGYDFSVICDCMVATPTQGGRPKVPYFFLQEFKKEKGDKIDAEAQMLVAMLLAQQENKDQKILYGGWFRGENWHFTTLKDRVYCVAPTLVATKKEELTQIVYMLQYLKTLILNR